MNNLSAKKSDLLQQFIFTMTKHSGLSIGVFILLAAGAAYAVKKIRDDG